MSHLAVSLVIEVHEDRLRSALFAPVERHERLIGLADCRREDSLSSTVEHLAESLAEQTGFEAAEIQRDPIFVVSGLDDLPAASVRMIDRRQTVAAACQSLAQTHGYPVVAVEHSADESEIVVTSVEHGQVPLIDTIVYTSDDVAVHDARPNAVEAVRRALTARTPIPGLVVMSERGLPQPHGVALLKVADMAVDLAYSKIMIVVDADELLPLAGALDSAALESVVQHDLLPYGVVLRASGEARDGVLAIRGVIESGDNITQRFSVPWGCVQYIDAPVWTQARVRLAMLNGAAVGGETQCMISTGAGTDVGRAGILLDARQPGAAIRRPDQIAAWLSDAGAVPASSQSSRP